jgi:DUF4097 and DUF4098 domain-containing protein YvlB
MKIRNEHLVGTSHIFSYWGDTLQLFQTKRSSRQKSGRPSSKQKRSHQLVLVAGLLTAGSLAAAAADYDNNIVKTFSVSSGGKLIVEASRGSINVATDGSDKVEVHIFRQVKGGTQSEADSQFREHEVTLEQNGNTVSIVEKSKKLSWGFRQRNLQVRYQITIPRKFDVNLRTAGGDIRLDELDGNALTHTSSGSVRIAKTSGSIEAKNAGGDISIEDAGGPVVAHTSSGSIKVQKARARLEASNSGGNIRLEDVGDDVVVSTSSGSITIAKSTGSVEANNAGGDVKIESAGGNVSAQTSSGSIHLGSIKGKSIRLRNSGGNIEVLQADGSVSAQTSSGSIRIKNASGSVDLKNSGGDIIIGEAGDVVAQTSSGSIKIDSAKGKVDAKNSGGDVSIASGDGEIVTRTSSGSISIGLAKARVEAKDAGGRIDVAEARDTVVAETSSGLINVSFAEAPKGDCRLAVAGGGIKLAVPQSAKLDLDARSSGGRVVSEMPITMAVSGESKSGELQGKINGGGPSMVLRASSGDIRLRQTPVAGTTPEREDKAK